MSTFRVEVLELSGFGKHPNADTLSITDIFGSPVIFRSEDFKKGDKIAYVPVDAVVPVEDPRFAFLADPNKPSKKLHRVKAKKLRQIYSEGIIIPALPEWQVGQDVAEALKITKYEEAEPLHNTSGKTERDPGFMPVYDIESYRKYKKVLDAMEPVVVTEKIHGCNSRFTYRAKKKAVPVCCLSFEEQTGGHHGDCPNDTHGPVCVFCNDTGLTDNPECGETDPAINPAIHPCGECADTKPRLWVASHKQVKALDAENLWWKVATAIGLEEKLKQVPGYVLYGECYGQVQDLKYDAKPGQVMFAAFDIYDSNTGMWLDYPEFKATCERLGIAMVPVLYEGPYLPDVIEPMRNGKSTIAGNIREGFVIKPVKNRTAQSLGRVILKFVGEDYQLRKGPTTEHH